MGKIAQPKHEVCGSCYYIDVEDPWDIYCRNGESVMFDQQVWIRNTCQLWRCWAE
jgi:hypothetical protein